VADDNDIRALVERGDMIAAIRLYRERHGGTLIGARQAVEDLSFTATVKRGAGSLEREVDDLIAAGDRIAAIKRHREVTGATLRESVDYVERRGAPPVPRHTKPDPGDVDAAIRDGDNRLAIDRHRERTGASLQAARAFVEARSAELAAPLIAEALQHELDRLVAAHKFVEAAAHHRKITGSSLAEAVAAVEARRLARIPDPHAAAADDAEVDRLILAGDKINAIKRYRALTGLGLIDCKHAVDARAAALAGRR
jgi:ribosomal protein L7/L12